ncbi:DUF1707 SHOCT-like domain-containing protein [Phaeacidiphilus oryzae]|uniref:DUF1707 SHOCT-like domain-containing protein n=1 Tax=Phaeacidiphilus oryzae TaxID=348818 RepID=UPI00055D5182|nr:DUF1707 domain-containing protein [Phaeacidiphilus oryzae]
MSDAEPVRRRSAQPPADRRAEAGLRAAHADREAVAERLREAAGDGRLTMEEFEERLERALTAKTYGELEPLVADLPETATAPRRPEDRPLVLRTGASNLRQDGYWRVPSRIDATVGMGNIRIDFTRADCPHREVVLKVKVGMGNIVVLVPRGWEVRSEGTVTGMGNVVNRVRERPDPGAPVLRLTGRVLMGNVKVRHPSRFEVWWQRHG